MPPRDSNEKGCIVCRVKLVGRVGSGPALWLLKKACIIASSTTPLNLRREYESECGE
jgi:hypothetical protein